MISNAPALVVDGAARAALAARYAKVRAATRALVAGLCAEDAQLQSMPDASPSKWHLAHTTWFFERFVLMSSADYQPLQREWLALFNSYYQSLGPLPARHQRGLLSRPSYAQILEYRERIDDALLQRLQAPLPAALAAAIELGCQHEQQHQELILTDILHAFAHNPLQPVLRDLPTPPPSQAMPLAFINGDDGLCEIGHGGTDFAFDCETPRHQVFLAPHTLANRTVSNGEYRAFIADGGYRNPLLWLSEGWSAVQQHGWQRPLYWAEDLDSAFTLGGQLPLDPLAPVVHVSFYEADAFARWAGARLPREAEWERAAQRQAVRGNFVESGFLQPIAASRSEGMQQLFGDVWEWTASPYVSYPGFRPLPGALGEYNGKFMSGQWVLRGGSCATPADHLRASYRNFFYPADRWQFSGLRLARDQ
ncbi:MAG: ergothioneine biosynthesis protein EgtB [Gammaproteobacteria bacterium HGW-Gammaproteobacteria-2]|jgi:ergothioneine biosynthesis protein EgtB|nr:MAG: ergothioneine biosynthesis protein EgtB [Gammaproteobacteria bacterium HGW-Gammaproteobacteria-2]